MVNPDDPTHVRTAQDMADTGVRLMRQNLRRRHPDAPDAEIDAMLRRWLTSRPLDAPGHVRLYVER